MDLLLLTFNVGDRIELKPHLNRSMMGDRFGEIVSIGRRYLHVHMDVSEKTVNVAPENATKVAEKWVDVAFAQGDDYTKIADMGVDQMAAHLTQWDYGQDTDDAHTRFVPVSESTGSDRVYQVRFHDLEYTLNVNHPHGYAGLSRRPVNVRKTDTEGAQK
jgi:hypothetical protein